MSTGFFHLISLRALLLFAVMTLPTQSYGQSARVQNYAGEIDPAFEFDGITIGKNGTRQMGKVIEFLLANSGGGTMIFDHIWIEVEHSEPYTLYTFPTGPLAREIPNKYAVKLSGKMQKFDITSDVYQLKAGEASLLQVRLDSQEKLQYRFFVVAEGFDLSSPNHRLQVRTPQYTVAFPEVVTYSDLVKRAKNSVDIYVNGYQTVTIVTDLWEFLQRSRIPIRILTTRAYYYGQGRFAQLLITIYGSDGTVSTVLTPSGTILGSGFEKYRNYSQYSPQRSPFIVIDGSLVLANESGYVLGKTSVYRDSLSIKKFEDKFAEVWNHAKPMSSKEYKAYFHFTPEDALENLRPDIRSLDRTRFELDEYAYLLRFVDGLAAERELQELANSTDSIVQSEAKRGLKLRGADEETLRAMAWEEE